MLQRVHFGRTSYHAKSNSVDPLRLRQRGLSITRTISPLVQKYEINADMGEGFGRWKLVRTMTGFEYRQRVLNGEGP